MSQLSKSLGRYLSHIIEKDGLYIHAENADVRIRVWSNHIIQIHISKNEQADFFSYAVNSKPIKTKFSIDENAKEIQLSTPFLTLVIKKNPVRFSFYNSQGKLINEDDKSFGTSWINSEMITFKKLQEGERFIGLGEKTRNIDRRGESFTNWNTDAYAYNNWSDPLYVSTPFFIGIHSEMVYGIYLDNSHKSKFNFGAANNRFASFSVEGGDMNYYFIHHNNVMDIIRSYTKLTGTMPLPPKWSLGYQQCRFSYYPDTEVKEIAETFRDKEIPCDVIYLDIHYMDKYKLFTWNHDRFPQPKKLISQLKRLGFHVVVIVDPGIKIEKDYQVYLDGLKKDVFVKYPDGKEYTATVWPGECHFPDFTKSESREWWGKQMKALTKEGLEGFWNDMNEPASWGNDTPDIIEFSYEGTKSTHKKARNIYGMQMARSTFEGLQEQLKGKRPFVLTRAGYSGIQRYAAVWTGDNTANDESMMVGVRMVNSLGLAGIPFSGFDVGGFVGETSTSLYQRWISIGAFTPFFRGHTMINTKRSEPWTYGEETEEIARNYISLRYRMMPYLYSMFKLASDDGTPVSRSLVIDYTHDSMVYSQDYQNQFLFGPSILVCPVESDKEFRKIYMPKGEWFDLYNDRKYRGSKEYVVETPQHRLPVFVKSSSIIPMQEQTHFADDKPGEFLFIHIYNGRSTGTFDLYEDDGSTYDYSKGNYYQRKIIFDPRSKKIVLEKAIGKYAFSFKNIRVYFHGFPALKRISINNKKQIPRFETYRFIQPISNFDPFYSAGDKTIHIDDLPFIELKHQKGRIEIKY